MVADGRALILKEEKQIGSLRRPLPSFSSSHQHWQGREAQQGQQQEQVHSQRRVAAAAAVTQKQAERGTEGDGRIVACAFHLSVCVRKRECGCDKHCPAKEPREGADRQHTHTHTHTLGRRATSISNMTGALLPQKCQCVSHCVSECEFIHSIMQASGIGDQWVSAESQPERRGCYGEQPQEAVRETDREQRWGGVGEAAAELQHSSWQQQSCRQQLGARLSLGPRLLQH